MNNFDSNRAIHSDMINYVVLGKDDKLLKSVQDGTIIALLVRDPFRIGYEGVKTALAAAEGEQASARVIIELNANVSVNQRTRLRR
jgi:ribose transport system substrate-binding protein